MRQTGAQVFSAIHLYVPKTFANDFNSHMLQNARHIYFCAVTLSLLLGNVRATTCSRGTLALTHMDALQTDRTLMRSNGTGDWNKTEDENNSLEVI